MTCFICGNPARKGEAVAREVTMFKSDTQTFRRTMTGRIAHVVCLQGVRYDENQLTLDDYVGQEERQDGSNGNGME